MKPRRNQKRVKRDERYTVDLARLRSARQSRMTQVEMGRQITPPLSPSHVSSMETGHRRFSVSMLREYCDAVGLDVSEVIVPA